MAELNDFKDLKDKIIELLNRKKVLSNGEIISFYDLSHACKKEFGVYSKFFKNNINKYGSKINNKSSLQTVMGIKVPFIDRVIPEIKDGNELITIYFKDSSKNNCGQLVIDKDGNAKLNNLSVDRFNKKYLEELINKCLVCFSPLMHGLCAFNEEYNMDFKWDSDRTNDKNTLRMSDGFITGIIDLNDTNKNAVTLTNVNDMYLASIKTELFGQLYEYIDFYNEEIQKRVAVNINDLSPLFKKIIDKHYDLDNEKKLIK